MTRDGLPRAYLRIDPNIDQVYPELRSSIIGLLCAAHRQPDRGRFRDRRLVEALCGRAYVARAFDREDLVTLPDGRPYVDGWDEWQEGDVTVGERMRRMRDRRKRKRDGRVTPPPSHRRNDVTTDALVSKESTVSVVGVGVGVDSPPPPAKRGRRKDGTNPRATGDDPRANGTNLRASGESPKQQREAEKRGPTSLREIIRRAAEEPMTADVIRKETDQ
jgi:hypothetical protein